MLEKKTNQFPTDVEFLKFSSVSLTKFSDHFDS